MDIYLYNINDAVCMYITNDRQFNTTNIQPPWQRN